MAGRIFITGASSGIGKAVSFALGHSGNILGLHARKQSPDFQAVLDDIASQGCRVEAFYGDLSDKEFVATLLSQFTSRCGGIDVLVNNAGSMIRYINFAEITPDEIDKTYWLNATVPFLLSREAFEVMRQGGGGRIINISSIGVKYGGSETSMHYAAAKSALETMTLGFARLGAKYNILANVVRPGLIDTPFHDKNPKVNMPERLKLVPLKRMGEPKEVAGIVEYLAGSQGGFTTGQVIEVAGGD